MTFDRWPRILALRLRTLFHRRAVERELDDELQYHVEVQTAEFIRQGLAPSVARTAALRALGGIEYHKEQVRDARGTRHLEEMAMDLVVAVRRLRRAPGFALAVVLTLALGIGANTAMFTMLRGTLLRPLPNRHGEQLVYLRQTAEGKGNRAMSFSVPEIADYRAATRSLTAIAEFSSTIPFTIFANDGVPARLRAAVISGNYFKVMGLEAALGRLTSDQDDGVAAASVTVLSHRYWQEHFGADSAVIGRSVRLNDQLSTVIGVVQAAPQYPRPTDIFVNTVASPHHLSATMVTDRAHRMTELFGRLAPDVTVEQARDELTQIAGAMYRDHPEAYDKASHFTVALTPLRDALNERASLTLWMLMGGATFVLLIACANVSNLTLMRGVGREREMVVRATLGAGRGRLRRLLLAENLLLALVGGTLGVLVAYAGLRLLVSFAAQLSTRANEIRIDGVVLALGVATSLVVAVVLSFVPRIGGERGLLASLAAAGRRSTLGRAGQRLQRSLVVVQLAVSMVLLTGAGLLVRTLANLQAVPIGMDAEQVLTIELPLEGPFQSLVMKQPENLAHFERLRDGVQALPGVAVASIATAAPLRGSILDFDLRAEGHAVSPNEPQPHASLRTVDPSYFAATGIPLLAGRVFTASDRRDAARVVVINAGLARQLFADTDPIGRRVAWTGDVLKFTPVSDALRTVVGVVGDTRDDGVERAATATVFEPFAQEFILGATMVVRTSGDPAAMQATITRTIRQLAPRQLIESVATVEQIRDESVAPRRLNAWFIGAFAALALLVAMVGIGGVLAFSVSARTAEIGIRMSLGARASQVQRQVLGEGGMLLAGGLLVGASAAMLAAQLMRGLLFGVSPYDPLTLGGVTIVLGAVGVAACWYPAARAARVDPAVALRAE